MTERHPDDEALSAVLDGEGDAADHDHVEGCRTCQARVDELQVVSHAVGAAIAARPEPEISAAVSRALADAPLAATRRAPARRAPAPPPSRWSPRGARVLAIAAAVVVVAGVGSIIAATSNHGSSHVAATSAKSATTAPAAGGAAALGSGATAAAPASQAANAPAPPLGDQSDPAALAATLRSLEQQNRAGSAATILSPPTCAPTAASGVGLEADARAIVALPVRWQGHDAQVLVFVRSTGAGDQVAVVVDSASCAVLTSFAV